MFRLELQPAYIIHARAYRDTSLLVDLFTPEYGRVGAVVRGVRVKKSRRRALMNPFIPLLVSLQGRSALKLLTHAEAAGANLNLQGVSLFSGLYLNELLLRLLPEWDAHAELYDDYVEALTSLAQSGPVEPVLRRFEAALLQAMGYQMDYACDAETQRPLVAGHSYRLEPGYGFVASASGSFPGEILLAIDRGDYSHEQVCRLAKHINRQLLAPLLGTRPLQSRLLFTRSE